MKLIKILLIFSLFVFFITPVSAQNPGIGLNAKNQPGGIKLTGNNNPEALFGSVFNNLLSLFFTVGALGFIIMFVWGAVDWILSGGDKEKVAGARKRIVTAITGLVILSLTFVAAIVVGQILNIQDLRQLKFSLPRLTN